MREIPFTYKFIKESLFELEAPLELLLVTGAMSRAQDEDAEMQLKRSWNIIVKDKKREKPVTLQDDYDAPPHPEDGGYDVAWPSVWISDCHREHRGITYVEAI